MHEFSKKPAESFADSSSLQEEKLIVRGYRTELAGGMKVILDEEGLATASRVATYSLRAGSIHPYLHAYEEARLVTIRPDDGTSPGLFCLTGHPKSSESTKTGRFRIPATYATNSEILGSDASLYHPPGRQGFAIGPEGKYWLDPCLADQGYVFSGPKSTLDAGSWRYAIEAELRLMHAPTGPNDKFGSIRLAFYEIVANNGALRLDFGSFSWKDVYHLRGDLSSYPEIYATGVLRLPVELVSVEVRLWLNECLALPGHPDGLRVLSGCVVKKVTLSR